MAEKISSLAGFCYPALNLDCTYTLSDSYKPAVCLDVGGNDAIVHFGEKKTHTLLIKTERQE